MTIDQFRASTPMTTHIKALLTSDVTLQTAIVAVQGEVIPSDVDLTMEPVASVRRLSYLAGYADAMKNFLSCSTAIAPPPEEQDPTWEAPKEEIPEGAPDIL